MDTVLIVEDNVSYNLFLQKKLKLAGYKVLSVIDGKSAIESVKNNQVDLIIMDYELPDLTGDKVLKAIHAYPKFKKIPVIVISGHNSLDMISDVSEAGINMIFRKKDVDTNKLINDINTQIKLHRAIAWIQEQELQLEA